MYKFFYIYGGTYAIKKKIAKDAYILINEEGKEKGQFHMKSLKPYVEKI